MFERAELERHHVNIVVASSPAEAIDGASARAMTPAPARRPSEQPDSLR